MASTFPAIQYALHAPRARYPRPIALFRAVLGAALFAVTVAGCSSSSSEGRKPVDLEEDDVPRISADTPELTLLELAMENYDRGAYSLSRESWMALRDGYPGSYYLPLAELKLADTHFYSSNFNEAIIAYQEFVRAHPGHEAVPYAMFQIGNAYFKQYSDHKRDQAPLREAIKAYNELIERFPRTDYRSAARNNIKRSRELLAAYEAYVADFYVKRGLIEPARARYDQLLAEFGETEVVREQGPMLAAALRAAGESVQEPQVKLPLPTPAPESNPELKLRAALSSADSTPPRREIVESDPPAVSLAQQEIVQGTTESGSDTVFRNTKPQIYCEESNGVATFVLTLPAAVNLVDEQRAVDNSVVATLQSAEIRFGAGALHCSAGSARVLVTSDVGEPQILRLNLRHEPNFQHTFFTLDRPFRFVTVVSAPR